MKLFKSESKTEHDWGKWTVDETQTQATRFVGVVNRRSCNRCGLTECLLVQPGRTHRAEYCDK